MLAVGLNFISTAKVKKSRLTFNSEPGFFCVQTNYIKSFLIFEVEMPLVRGK